MDKKSLRRPPRAPRSFIATVFAGGALSLAAGLCALPVFAAVVFRFPDPEPLGACGALIALYGGAGVGGAFAAKRLDGAKRYTASLASSAVPVLTVISARLFTGGGTTNALAHVFSVAAIPCFSLVGAFAASSLSRTKRKKKKRRRAK